MSNDATCLVIGMGTVNIKMFDGIVRVFEDVRHIPDLRKNLSSLGVLTPHFATINFTFLHFSA